jgi:hypothetical protein
MTLGTSAEVRTGFILAESGWVTSALFRAFIYICTPFSIYWVISGLTVADRFVLFYSTRSFSTGNIFTGI